MAGDTTELWLIVTNSSTAPITVNGFQLTIPPEGSNADELTADIAAIHAIGPDGWSTSPGPAFRFIPTGGTLVFQPDDSIQLRLTNVKVNATPGPVTFSISDGTTPPSSITLTKLPPGFRLSPLTAVPTTATGYPGSTSLSWTGPPLDSPYAPGYSLSWVVDGGDGDDTKTASGLPAVATHYAIDGLTHESTTITLTVAYTVDEQPASVFRQVTVSVPVPAPKASLTITPAWYGPNDQISLTWDVEHSSVVSIEPNLGTVDLTGTQTIGPAANAPTYTLSADVLPGFAGGRAVVSARPAPYSLVTTNNDGIRPAGLAVSPDGNTLYVASDGGASWSMMVTLDPRTLNQTGVLSQNNGLNTAFVRQHDLLVSPDGAWLYGLSGGSGSSSLSRHALPGFDGSSPDIALPDAAATAAMARDGTWLVAACGSSLQRIDLVGWSAGARATFGAAQSNVDSVAISPDSTAVYAVGSTTYSGRSPAVTRYSGTDLTASITTALAPQTPTSDETRTAVAVAPDGASIVAIVDMILFRLDATTMTIMSQATLPQFALRGVYSLAPIGAIRWVGRWILVGTGSGLVVFDSATLTPALNQVLGDGMQSSVTQIAVSADGRTAWWNGFRSEFLGDSQPGTVYALSGIPR